MEQLERSVKTIEKTNRSILKSQKTVNDFKMIRAQLENVDPKVMIREMINQINAATLTAEQNIANEREQLERHRTDYLRIERKLQEASANKAVAMITSSGNNVIKLIRANHLNGVQFR